MPNRTFTDYRRPVVILGSFILACFVLYNYALFPWTPSGATVNMGSKPPAAIFKFEAVTDVFMQSQPGTDPSDFDNTKQNFGLIHQTYPTDQTSVSDVDTDWQRFMRYVHYLKATTGDQIDYKVLYLGRHGEGFHNVAEAYYGTKAWDDYWSKLDGNGTINWLDAHLTDVGKEQARAAGAFMQAQLVQPRMMPAPEGYYVSPMYRCLQTATLTWGDLKLPPSKPFKPLIKELVREVLGEHTCDKRSTRTAIHEAFPDFPIEEGFAEQDELWRADHRETHEEHDARTQALLDDLFTSDDKTVLSLTSHSGTIASFLRVLGHREFKLPTGGMIPVLIKATRLD
ncbi:hypothetical protein CKM354_000543800 [Cercospora kikuchii]|uniref:Phosphoglycerate mutase n=1 Tax=Cercospora kikuchii TaxID=84275 RepID=A0A9P3CM18_9PEZI|nr:uncharacterized protein CKM354_000543800 [Cercospora kikuchii]GIZ42160.1 hypothetical protein CKM354_000543800 [Cercospora kikuchii]